MRRILITAIGGDVSCAIIRCLLEDCKQDELYGYDIQRYTPYMDYFTVTKVAPRYTDETYGAFMKEFVLKYKITHFIPATEAEILIADANMDFFKKYGVKVLINNSETIHICTSKYLTAESLKNYGIKTPRTMEASKYRGGLSFPFILKADYGNGGESVRIIHNQTEWDTADKRGMVCQQKVGTNEKEYTVGVFSDGKKVNSIILKRKLGLGYGNGSSGLSVEVCCCDIPEIRNIAEKAAKALNIVGSINIQIREEYGQFYVFEINARFSSTVGFRHKMGFKDAVWWLDMIDGVGDFPEFHSPVGKIGIKVTDDKIIKGGVISSVRFISPSGKLQVAAA